MSLRLSVLDQSPISAGSTGAVALRNTLDLARLADALGYHRYWVAEHHGGPMLAGTSPEALIGPIAATTAGIRVGSGGVMLPHYSPVKVAETFSVLAAPRVVVAVWSLCAGSDAEAEQLAASARMATMLARRGKFTPVPRVETAVRFIERRMRSYREDPGLTKRMVHGSPAAVRGELE